jgi:predicted dienelactone hydrolase
MMRWMCLVAFSACAAEPDVDPAARGPFNVGHRLVEARYLPPGATADRTIAVDVWYPTQDKSGASSTYFGLLSDDRAFADASAAKPQESTYPVIVYSHGSQAFAATSASLMRHFASHGFVALAPTHTGGTLSDSVPTPPALFALRALDLSAALDLELPFLPAKKNTNKVLAIGHSFGGRTVWSAAGGSLNTDTVSTECANGQPPCNAAERDAFFALKDERVAAAIAMASARTDWFTPASLDAISVPLFFMSGGADQIGQAELWASTAASARTWIDIAGGCHQLFALGGCEEVPDTEGFAIVNTYAMAFARRVILQDQSDRVVGILSGETSVSPRVQMQRR